MFDQILIWYMMVVIMGVILKTILGVQTIQLIWNQEMRWWLQHWKVGITIISHRVLVQQNVKKWQEQLLRS